MSERVTEETRKRRLSRDPKDKVPVLTDKGNAILTSVWNPSLHDVQEYRKVPFYKDITFTGRTFPYVVRNLLQLYSKEGARVYDPMLGSGTTLYEATALKRKVAGSDVEIDQVEDFKVRWRRHVKKPMPRVCVASATKIPVKDNFVDLVIMSFPWYNTWKFTKNKKNEGMDNCKSLETFLALSNKIYKEMFRVLKPGGYVANILGNTYQKGVYYPITMEMPAIIKKVGLVPWYQFWNLRVEAKHISFPWTRSGLDCGPHKADNGVGWDVHEDIIVARKKP